MKKYKNLLYNSYKNGYEKRKMIFSVMGFKNAKQTIEDLLTLADIKINGDRPWDVKVHNEELYTRVLAEGALGLGESYMDGWWDCDQLDQFFNNILRAELDKKVVSFNTFLLTIKSKIINLQSKPRAKKVAEQHYDLGNDFFEHMLDKRMQYTCAYWKDADNLDTAQEHKLELICKKIMLNKEDKVLELGCGWGGFAKYAAEKYGCHITAINISSEQVKYAKEICKGLPVEIIHDDYRNAKGVYDKVVAIGLCEHVGYKNYRSFMKLVHSCLKSNGLFLLHTIGGNISVTSVNPWTDKYIFPNGMLPSPKQLTTAWEGLFVLEDWHNFGPHYDKTLMAWYNNFEKHWDKFKSKYGDRFYRMWKYYLLSSAGSFRSRACQLWQIVLSKEGIPGGYESVR